MTLYFKQEHFKTSVPVAITTMLVMYTLNQSISSKLPATSYIKFIDVWLLFGLIQPFFIIILLVLIEHFPQGMVKAFSSQKIDAEKPVVHAFLKTFAKFILPVLETLFIIVYFIVALGFYFE